VIIDNKYISLESNKTPEPRASNSSAQIFSTLGINPVIPETKVEETNCIPGPDVKNLYFPASDRSMGFFEGKTKRKRASYENFENEDILNYKHLLLDHYHYLNLLPDSIEKQKVLLHFSEIESLLNQKQVTHRRLSM